jgi:hypothetical protein
MQLKFVVQEGKFSRQPNGFLQHDKDGVVMVPVLRVWQLVCGVQIKGKARQEVATKQTKIGRVVLKNESLAGFAVHL